MSPRHQRQGIAVNAFAKSLGVTHKAVADRIKRGSLADAVLDDGSLDEEKARVLWFANMNPNRVRARTKDIEPAPRDGRGTAKSAEESRGEFKVKMEREEIALRKETIQLSILEGSVIKSDDARLATRALMRTYRDGMLNFANRYGAAIAAEFGVPAAAFVGALEAKIREALIEIATTPAPFDINVQDESESE